MLKHKIYITLKNNASHDNQERKNDTQFITHYKKIN